MFKYPGVCLEDRIFCSVTPFYEFGHWVAYFTGMKEDMDHFFTPSKFTGGEFCPSFHVDVKDSCVVKDRTVYIIANPEHRLTPQEIGMRAMIAANAAKENGAKKVVLVQSDLAYGRQDRSPKKDKKLVGQPYTTLLQARLFHAAEIDMILAMHLHSNKIYHAFGRAYFGDEGESLGQKLDEDNILRRDGNRPILSDEEHTDIEDKLERLGRKIIYNLDPNPLLAHYLSFSSSLDLSDGGRNIVFIAPDAGAKVNIDRLRSFMFLPNSSVAYCTKLRKASNDPSNVSVELGGKSDNYTGIAGKQIIIADDIVDTGGTITQTMKALLTGDSSGTPSGIYLCFTHPVLAALKHEDYYQEVQHFVSSVNPKEIVTFDTHPYINDHRIPKWKQICSVIRVAHLIGDAIINCVDKNTPPKMCYGAASLEELDKRFGPLYDVKRSSWHPSSTNHQDNPK